jgi:hypothetical protein
MSGMGLDFSVTQAKTGWAGVVSPFDMLEFFVQRNG